jgi:hypothetical protein
MGTTCAVLFADLFLYSCEEKKTSNASTREDYSLTEYLFFDLLIIFQLYWDVSIDGEGLEI